MMATRVIGGFGEKDRRVVCSHRRVLSLYLFPHTFLHILCSFYRRVFAFYFIKKTNVYLYSLCQYDALLRSLRWAHMDRYGACISTAQSEADYLKNN